MSCSVTMREAVVTGFERNVEDEGHEREKVFGRHGPCRGRGAFKRPSKRRGRERRRRLHHHDHGGWQMVPGRLPLRGAGGWGNTHDEHRF